MAQPTSTGWQRPATTTALRDLEAVQCALLIARRTGDADRSYFGGSAITWAQTAQPRFDGAGNPNPAWVDEQIRLVTGDATFPGCSTLGVDVDPGPGPTTDPMTQ